METYAITPVHISEAPNRSFSGRSALAGDIREWYDSEAMAVKMRLGEKDDTERDGSDSQLRDTLCLMAGFKRERVPVMENGAQVLSEKRGNPVFKDEPFTSANRINALEVLNLREKDLGKIGTSRIVSLVKVSGETVTLADDSDEEYDEN